MNRSTAHQTVLIYSLQPEVHVNITQYTDRTAKCQTTRGVHNKTGHCYSCMQAVSPCTVCSTHKVHEMKRC